MIKIVVKKDLCTSCGVCWHEMCDVFGHDQDSLVVLQKETIEDARKEHIERVADICPGEVIEYSQI